MAQKGSCIRDHIGRDIDCIIVALFRLKVQGTRQQLAVSTSHLEYVFGVGNFGRVDQRIEGCLLAAVRITVGTGDSTPKIRDLFVVQDNRFFMPPYLALTICWKITIQ